MNEPCYLLPESVRQALAQYLVNQPWYAVDAILRALMDLKPATGNPPYTSEVIAPKPPKTQAELAAEESTKAKRALEKIDRDSIRSIREYLAGKPDAPQALKNLEAAAVVERVKVKP